MSIIMRCRAEDLVSPFEKPKEIVRTNTSGPSTRTVAAEAGGKSLTGRDRNRSIGTSSITEILPAAEAAKHGSKKSAMQFRFPKEPELDSFSMKCKAMKTVCWTIDQALEKLGERVGDLAEQTIGEARENCHSNVNKLIIRRATRNALHDPLWSILLDDTCVREAFETAVVHVTRESG